MKLSQIKKHLTELENIDFQLPDGNFVPNHFHVTEVGKISKHFIDCGGTVRNEEVVSFQLWEANDSDHRLKPEKLLDIIQLSEKVLNIEDLEIEVEYQGSTIGKYGIDFNGTYFLLTTKLTDCLAKDKCGIMQEVMKVEFSQLQDTNATSCNPNSGCC